MAGLLGTYDQNLKWVKERNICNLPSRNNEGKRPSGDITTGPSGKALPSCQWDHIIT